MKRFEYFCEVKTEFVTNDKAGWQSLHDELNAMGAQGWELVAANAVIANPKPGVWRTWKRELPNA